MVKPNFKLRLPSYVKVCGKPESKAEAVVKRKNTMQKENQIINAVKWCQDNGNY